MKDVKSYRDLIVWQKAMTAVEFIYVLTKDFPVDERWGLSSQLRRAAISIPSNIAEGHSRNSTRDFVHFLSIAQGSRAEAETQILLAIRLNYLLHEQAKPTLSLIDEISRMIAAIRSKLAS